MTVTHDQLEALVLSNGVKNSVAIARELMLIREAAGNVQQALVDFSLVETLRNPDTGISTEEWKDASRQVFQRVRELYEECRRFVREYEGERAPTRTLTTEERAALQLKDLFGEEVLDEASKPVEPESVSPENGGAVATWHRRDADLVVRGNV